MGSWHHTCAISNLPICYHDKVMVVMLVRTASVETPNIQNVRPDAHWRPLGFPFYGLYNDVGFVEDIEDTEAARETLALINRIAVEHSAGPRQHRDVAVTPGEIDFEALEEILHDDRLQDNRNVFNGYNRPVFYCLIRCDVFDRLFHELSMEVHAGGTWRRNTTGAQLSAIFHDDLAAYRAQNTLDRGRFVHAIRFEDGYRKVGEQLRAFDKQRSFDDNQNLANEIGRLLALDEILRTLRRHYAPQTGSGSQDADWAAYLKFNEITGAICQQALTGQNSEDEGEDEEAEP